MNVTDHHHLLLTKTFQLCYYYNSQFKLIVHFEFGDQKFAKRISVDVINKLYEDVVFTLHKRNPGYIPSCLQIQCGSCWYNFTKDTELDDLCLTDSNPELSIRAVPMPTDLGNIFRDFSRK